MSNEAPVKPISSGDVGWTEWSTGRFGERYRHLTRACIGENYRVGVAIEELEPGKQSAPAHYHIFEEEHVYVLDGRLTARIGDGRFGMRAGDYVCFPAGRRAGHCLVNDGDATCRYVIIGEHDPNEVAVYTDSRKVLVRALGADQIFDLDALRSYFDGEVTGLPDEALPRFDPKAHALTVRDEPVSPVAADTIAWQDEGRGRNFGGRSKHLTHAAVGASYRAGVLVEAPNPGQRLAPRHYHLLEEEHALILEGQVTLLLGDERHEMTPGDYVCFTAGRRVAHSFLNAGSGPCSYLMIGQRNPNDVCVYPDSNKMYVRALGEDGCIFDMSARRAYWDGEAVE